ncbi:hypothetical protein EAG18_16825 [Pseudoalteromonas sp. J010]|nr:hypothetical protein EAG18_16825 [Pseudoalteromonas sp. J010]
MVGVFGFLFLKKHKLEVGVFGFLLERRRLLKKTQISGGCLWFSSLLFFFLLFRFFFIDECYEAKVLVMFLADVSLSLWLLSLYWLQPNGNVL